MAAPPPSQSEQVKPWGRWSDDGLTFTVVRAGEGQFEHVLDAPTPALLAETLRQLLTAADPALGCLTPRTRVRLFRHGRELAAPWVAAARFDETRAVVDALAELLTR